MNDRIDRVKDDHKDHGADNIKVQVNKRCTSRIFGGEIPESIAVTHVPIFCPMMIGRAVPKLTAPVAHNA